MKIDICFLDFDGCLYPGISKVRLAFMLTRLLSLKPVCLADWKWLPRVFIAGLSLYQMRIIQRLWDGYTDADLVKSYIHWLAPVPGEYFVRTARSIPQYMFPGTFETLAWLVKRCPVGIISLALQIVLDEVDHQLAERYGVHFTFKLGNPLNPYLLNGSEKVLTGEDKRRHMLAAMEKQGCKSPLVIGNDREDLGLVQVAQESGGISVGFRPTAQARPFFDFVVDAPDWCNMIQSLSPFFRD